MTSLDLAEQLQMIGRQLQALEHRLTQPLAVLAFPVVLQQLLTDPLTRLAEVVQPLANWPTPLPTRDDSAPALAPSRMMQRAVQPPVDPSRGHRRSPGEASMSWGAPRWSAEHSVDTHRLPVLPAAGDGLPQRSDISEAMLATPPSQGTRLTRERSALLSMLQSHMAPTGEPLAVPEAGGALTTGTDARATRSPADILAVWSSVTERAAPLLEPGMGTQRPYAMVQHVPGPEPAQADSETAVLQHDTPGYTARFSPPAREEHPAGWHGSQLGTGTGGASPPFPPLPFVSDAAAEQVPGVASLVTDHAQSRTPSLPDVDNSLPPLQSDAIFGQDSMGAAQALSAVQLEHILDALAERLELTLLRLYGTTGA